MSDYLQKYIFYKNEINRLIDTLITKSEPSDLYGPIKYILSAGGKRLRPVLTLFTTEAFGGNYKDAINAAISIELLHNFTLVHDDIMDNADTRRGRETIHNKWDRDIAILAGDYLVAVSLESLNKTKSEDLHNIYSYYIDSLSEVCEGQIYDKRFEMIKNVSIENYLMMCRKKTSKLLEACTAIGALIAGADSSSVSAAIEYAKNLGLAFQMQDDLLDIMADEKEFGKRIGGDIKEGKKTFLLLKAVELVKDSSDKKVLNAVLEKDEIIKKDYFVDSVREIYVKYGIIKIANELIQDFTYKADLSLEQIIKKEGKELLKWFSNMILNRNH